MYAGAVTFAGAGGGGYLWSVEGGNYRVPQALLKESQANLIKSTVIKVWSQNSNIVSPYKVQILRISRTKWFWCGCRADFSEVCNATFFVK